MTSVFCDVDDFCLIFEPQWHKQLICNDKKSPVISKLTLSEIMTISRWGEITAYSCLEAPCLFYVELTLNFSVQFYLTRTQRNKLQILICTLILIKG